MNSEIAKADAIADEVLTPEALEKIEQAVMIIGAGRDPRSVLRLLYSMAYMDGMLSMAKVGVPQ